MFAARCAEIEASVAVAAAAALVISDHASAKIMSDAEIAHLKGFWRPKKRPKSARLGLTRIFSRRLL